MATWYSNLYASSSVRGITNNTESTTTSYSYKGPIAEKVGDHQTIRATYDCAGGAVNFSNSDVLHICKLPAGAKIIRITLSSGDDDVDSDNDFTFDLGTTTTANLYLNDSTVLQAGAETAYVSEELEEIAAASAGDSLLLTAAAGETNSSGTIYFLVEYVVI